MALLAATAGLAALAGSAQAQILNPSFESPNASSSPTGVSTVITSWEKLPQPGYFSPEAFFLTWDSVTGIFPNQPLPSDRHITNADGNQVAYIFAFPFAGITQQLGTTFEAGMSYDLTFGLRGGGTMTAGTQFLAGLQYFNGTDWTGLGTTIVTAQADENTITALRSTKVHSGTIAPEAAGKPVRVILEGLSFSGASGLAYWEADKLELTAVPEPETYAVVAALGLLGGAIWRRCRQTR